MGRTIFFLGGQLHYKWHHLSTKPLFTWYLWKVIWVLHVLSISMWEDCSGLHHCALFSITVPCSSPTLFFFLFWEGGSFLSLIKSHQPRSTSATCNRLKHNRPWRVSNCTLFRIVPRSPASLWTACDCVIDTYSSSLVSTHGCAAVCLPQPPRHRNCTQAISRQAVFLDLSL